jgi:alpha-tubulin suppressor-like RCC1 family protein
MTSIRGYVIERRRCPEGPVGYPLPNLDPAKYNSKAIEYWSNTVWSCGAGGEGRTGLETRKDVIKWKRVPYFTERNISIVSIALGQSFSVFLTVKGDIYVVGYGRKGQLGDGKVKKWEQLKPQKVPVLKDVVHVSAGLDSCFALTRSRQVYAWGSGKHGKLGLNDCEDKFTPQLVVELSTGGDSGVVEIAAGSHHAHAITSGGSLFSWGLNTCGQLGLGRSLRYISKPTIVKEFKLWKGSVIGVYTSSNFSAAILKIPNEPIDITTMEQHEKNIVIVKKLLRARRAFNIRITCFESVRKKKIIWRSFLRKWKQYYTKLKNISEFTTQLKTNIEEQNNQLNLQQPIEMNNNETDSPTKAVTSTIQNIQNKNVSQAVSTEEETKGAVENAQSYKSYLDIYETLCKSLGQIHDTTVIESKKLFLLEAAKMTLKDLVKYNKKVIVDVNDEINMHVIKKDNNTLLKNNIQGSNEGVAAQKINMQKQQHDLDSRKNSINDYNHDHAVFIWGYGGINLGLGEVETKWYSNKIRSKNFRHQFLPRLHRFLSTITTIQYNHNDAEGDQEDQTKSFTGVHKIALGTEHGLALTTDQRVFVWGRNNYGQCGYRTTLRLKIYKEVYIPKEIIYLKGTVQIAAGSKFILSIPIY